MSLGRTRERFEREYLVEVLERHSWNVKAAAREVELAPETLAARIKRLAIQRPPKRVRPAPRRRRDARAPRFRRIGPRTWGIVHEAE